MSGLRLAFTLGMTHHDSHITPEHGGLDCDGAALAGCSLAVRELRRAMRPLAHSEVNLLIRGEAGVGKGAWAEAIHDQSPRSAGPFVVLRRAGLGADRAEAELFGNREIHRPTPRGRAATVYLDTIEALPARLQQRLLEALSSDDLGGVRIIAGTASSLAAQLRFGRLCHALYQRLAVVEIDIPPLRERREDVAAIAEHCSQRWSETAGSAAIVFADRALAELEAYSWPGNTRELVRVLEAARAGACGRPITGARIRAVLHGRPRGPAGTEVVPLRQVERDYLCAALVRCGGNQTLAARRLGIGRSTLFRKLRELGLESHEVAGRPPRRPPASLRRVAG